MQTELCIGVGESHVFFYGKREWLGFVPMQGKGVPSGGLLNTESQDEGCAQDKDADEVHHEF